MFSIIRCAGAGMAIALVIAIPGNAEELTAPQNPYQIGVEGISYSEGSRIIRRFLSNSEIRRSTQGQRLRVLRLSPVTTDGKGDAGVYLTVFNYTMGKALRYQVNPQTGTPINRVVLTGQPAASEEEILEAIELLYQYPELAQLARGGIVEDGFAVTPPPGQSSNHRYIQLRILNGARSQILKTITVDLTQGTILPENN